MKLWRWLLVLLLVAALAAFGWHWVAADPGQVLIRIRGWRVQTSLLVLLVGLLLLWLVLAAIGKLLRWPFRSLPRYRQRLGQKRLAAGLEGLLEGRHGEAERKLLKAARYAPLRASAQLLEADAARSRGAWQRALAHLDKAAETAPRAARVLRARVLRESGQPEQALQLLLGGSNPSPAGWHERVLARLALGDARGALADFKPLQRSGFLAEADGERLQQQILAAALAQAECADELGEIWRHMSRAQRQHPELVALYVRHAAQHGAGLAAVDELKSSLRRHWDTDMAAVYLGLDAEAAERRLHQGEAWLKDHPDDAVLLGALGSLCARQGLDGKARQYLQQAVELDPKLPAAWAALGDVARDEGDDGTAAHCYRNALGAVSGANASPLLTDAQRRQTLVLEERNEHGVPQLPGEQLAAEDEGA